MGLLTQIPLEESGVRSSGVESGVRSLPSGLPGPHQVMGIAIPAQNSPGHVLAGGRHYLAAQEIFSCSVLFIHLLH